MAVGPSVRYYCDDCEAMICSDCCDEDHYEHDVYDIVDYDVAESEELLREKLTQWLTGSSSSLAQIEYLSEQIGAWKEDCSVNVASLRQDIDDEEDRIVCSIRSDADELRRLLATAGEEADDEVEQIEQAVDCRVSQLKMFAENCGSVLERGVSDDEIIKQFVQLSIVDNDDLFTTPILTKGGQWSFAALDLAQYLPRRLERSMNVVGKIIREHGVTRSSESKARLEEELVNADADDEERVSWDELARETDDQNSELQQLHDEQQRAEEIIEEANAQKMRCDIELGRQKTLWQVS